MSAGKSAKKGVYDAGGGEDVEQWLYGGTTVTDGREDRLTRIQVQHSKNAMSSLKVASDSEVDNQLAGQDNEDSDSDSDDNFCVTIGDIRLGEAPQSVGSGHTPVNLNIQAKGRIHADGVDVSALGNVHRGSVTALDVDLDSYEEKPWNKPGADITDYFNYGFVEETWKAYCNVQRMLRTIHESKTSSSTKIRDQKGRTGHRETGSCCDNPLSGRPGHSTTDVIGGQTGSISRMEGRRCEVLSEDKEKFSSHPSHISVPPLLSPAFNIRSASPLSPSPPFRGTPSPLLISPLSMLQSKGWDSPSVPLYAVSTGACPPVLTSMTYFTGLLKRAEAFQHHTQQDRKQDRNRERSRSREHGHNNVRERDRDREQRSPHNRYEKLSPGRKRQDREWKHRDEDKGRHKTLCRRRKRDDDDNHSFPKHKRFDRGW